MSPLGPLPESLKDGAVHGLEATLAHHMSVILCPAPNDGIELGDQDSCWHLLLRFDQRSDFPKKRLDVLARRLDQHLAVVLAYVLSEKIKAILDMRDGGFL